MRPQDADQITHLLNDWKSGDEEAMSQVMAMVYDQLKLLAHRYTIKERSDRTLNTTGLVHEAYLKIIKQNNRNYQDRAHFYAIVSTCMRRVILEVARSRNTNKRGNDAQKVEVKEHFLISETDADQVLSVNEALEKLTGFDPRLAEVVEHRYFGGLKLEEIAEAMDCSLSTVKRDWRLAKTWLQNELKDH
jgi:RNA polymerase sigma-70 factor (ECF subfamily)